MVKDSLGSNSSIVGVPQGRMTSLTLQLPQTQPFKLGTHYLGDRSCSFQVWAPNARAVEVHLIGPDNRLIRLESTDKGYHQGRVEEIEPGARYYLKLDGKMERPDPASRFQPEGVHGPSEVTDPDFNWNDSNWFGLPLRDYIIYELHV
ncbi:MAG: malto-oligosyltrehalose trehalohydrolase, partial [Pedosphaera sp.]|nr:malto-oligosyltrehalose trehalohydrolase [Pedosphaera sp.]